MTNNNIPPSDSSPHDDVGASGLSRRQLLGGMTGLAAAGLGANLLSPAALAHANVPTDTTAGFQGRIDVHAHYLPKEYREAAAAAGHSQPDGMPGLPDWDVPKALSAMDRFGIASAVLSVSSPGVHFGDDAKARDLARFVNEVGATAVQDHPARFGLFASLPLPDIDGALEEMAYALDTLGADGVVIGSNHHGIYPGDERLDPVFAELDRRGAVVFMHPTSPHCPCCQGPAAEYPRPMMEFMFETSRAVTHLILKGTLDKFPNLRLVVPHAGAMMPLLIDRITGLSPALGLDEPLDTEHAFALMRGLYYDLAGFPVPRQLGALLSIADPKRILYGSDWPFTPDPVVQALSETIDTTELLNGIRRDVLRHNALALFPRLRQAQRSGT